MSRITHGRVQIYRQALVNNLRVQLDGSTVSTEVCDANHIAQQQNLANGELNLTGMRKDKMTRTTRTQCFPLDINPKTAFKFKFCAISFKVTLQTFLRISPLL